MYDLLLKNGTLIDPSQKIHDQIDIGISLGEIAMLAPDISPSEARRTLDAQGSIVVPGLTDIHPHLASSDRVHAVG